MKPIACAAFERCRKSVKDPSGAVREARAAQGFDNIASFRT